MPPKPHLIYDGDCGFCRRWVARWRSATGDAVHYEPYQQAAPRFPDIAKRDFETAVQWIGADGARARGAHAVFLTLAASRWHSWWLALYRRSRGFAALSEWLYRLVAARRPLFSRIDLLLWGPVTELPAYHRSTWLLLRLLGLVYLAAFLSAWSQAAGLWGSEGIFPVSEYLDAAYRHWGKKAYAYVPSLFWLADGDAWIPAACAAGAAISAAVALGLASGPALLALWALYLSLLSVGGNFMSFQWDVLLVESGFLAMLVAPWRWIPKPALWRPPQAGVWLMRLLLFRLMFESGAVKWLSGDQTWRDLSALTFHYETQPLPTWIAWYVHQLPRWFHSATAAGVFAVELALPFAVFMPRRPRLACFGIFAAFQAAIAATGNYCFFNALAATLSLTLVDDAALGALGRRLAPEKAKPADRPFRGAWATVAGSARTALFSLLAALALIQLGAFAGLRAPAALDPLLRAIEPVRLVNRYGLFAIMTTSRPEIVLEGSEDGRAWREYRFKWKPGDPLKRPGFVAPHQPRLDWQMWFAALGTCQENEWFVRFMARLLEGSAPVAGLLEHDPFEGGRPTFLRSTIYDYKFTRFGDEGWWRRRPVRPYCPVVASRRAG